MDTLNDLLAASDVISLHCALTDDMVQIINAECLQHVNPGKHRRTSMDGSLDWGDAQCSDTSLERESTSLLEDVTALSGMDQVLSSSSRFASPEDIQSPRADEYSSEPRAKSNIELPRKPGELVKDGYIVALHARDYSLLHLSRQRVKGALLKNMIKRDSRNRLHFVTIHKLATG
ncbi:hypothetical protein LIER_22920 [Lithospermum erythrorhizon]|uniref:D-isomer specific 2-hydroxyacid dehydrogenase NAD-binding domain-containing protein n=1 Tax=Lithospermum erythrorhizon TaxID=34254 RepID=A0AAV3QY47_LITER